MLKNHFGSIFIREDFDNWVIRFVFENDVLVFDMIKLYARGVVQKNEEVLCECKL